MVKNFILTTALLIVTGICYGQNAIQQMGNAIINKSTVQITVDQSILPYNFINGEWKIDTHDKGINDQALRAIISYVNSRPGFNLKEGFHPSKTSRCVAKRSLLTYAYVETTAGNSYAVYFERFHGNPQMVKVWYCELTD